VLHRVLFGQWTVEPPEPGDRLRLLSWWSPLMSTIVLAPRPTYRAPMLTRCCAQLEAHDLYTALFDLRLLGVVELLALVLGVPFGAWQAVGTALGACGGRGRCLPAVRDDLHALAFSTHGLASRGGGAALVDLLSVTFAAPRGAEVPARGDVARRAALSRDPRIASRRFVSALGSPIVYDARNATRGRPSPPRRLN